MSGTRSTKSKKRTINKRFARLQERMALPERIRGERVKEFSAVLNLHSTEVGYMLGINNSAVYRKQSHNDSLTASLSILFRHYGAMPELIQRHTPPNPSELMKRIAKIDPSIRPMHLSVILGLEQSAAHRFRDSLDKSASQVVRVLSLLVWRAIEADPENWWKIKKNIEVEAETRGIVPGSQIWETLGGWQDRQGPKKMGTDNTE